MEIGLEIDGVFDPCESEFVLNSFTVKFCIYPPIFEGIYEVSI